MYSQSDPAVLTLFSNLSSDSSFHALPLTTQLHFFLTHPYGMVITKPCSCSSSSFSPSALLDAPGFPPPIRHRRCPPLWSQPDLSFPVIRRCWYFSPDRQFHSTNCLGIGPFSLPSSSSISTSLVKLPRIRPKSALSLFVSRCCCCC